MTKKKHNVTPINEKITKNIKRMQDNIKSATALVPWKKSIILTPAEPSGPDIEYFRNVENSLFAWSNKQKQTWKFAGHLSTSTDRKFGFQLVFNIRQTETDRFSKIPLRWLKPKIFSAQSAITDFQNAKQKYTFQSWQRGGMFGLEQGYADEHQFHLEVGGWYAWRNPTGTFSVFSASEGNSLNLHFTPSKPISYPGQRGYLQLGPHQDLATYFCSYSQMHAKGTVLLQGKLHEVTGTAWLDHEKMTLKDTDLLEKSERYHFFMPNNEELFFQIIYNSKGEIGTYSTGTYIGVSENQTTLIATDFKIENLKFWKSNKTQARYPLKKIISISALGIELEIKPLIEEQEFDSFKTNIESSWSGSVEAKIKRNNEEFTAHGFMELSGFDERKTSRFLKSIIESN